MFSLGKICLTLLGFNGLGKGSSKNTTRVFSFLLWSLISVDLLKKENYCFG